MKILKYCRDRKLTPAFATIKYKMRNNWNHTAFDRLNETPVRMEIRRTRAALDRLSREALTLHLRLAAVIRYDLWKVADASAALKASNQERKAQEKHDMKLARLETR